MEEKRRDTATGGGGGGGDSPASAEPASSSRRRAGGQKRKAGNFGSTGSSSSSAPSKRVTREKASLLSHSHHSLLQIHNHNGPLTRARQGPTPSATPAPLASASKPPLPKVPGGEAAAEAALRKQGELEALEAAIEAKFESVRSRSPSAHVVPNHCGWFSWTKVHPVEERTLVSFFDGMSEIRTADTYLEIRNWIMRKFHENPGTQIELKDLSELEVADLDARQEVLEFLDYWGLINFHPFPQPSDPIDNAGGDSTVGKVSLADRLYRFETPQSSKPVTPTPKNNVTAAPTVPSGLFPESAITEELMKLEGPSVEYHCNSCSADCSRKRYHCQKQADFDLCSECYSNKKFDSGMSSSDFILMEPGEVPGLSGGKWTDQETLLLLEALELYKENWNEIAEHVATKTRAQCILHFVQMPIEDSFLDINDDNDSSSKETSNPSLAMKDSSAPKDASQATEGEVVAKDNQSLTSPAETLKEETKEDKSRQDSSKEEDVIAAKASQESTKLVEENESKDCQETGEEYAVNALKQAFDAVGYPLPSEGSFSFVDAGNPVMALAAFLANLVGPDLATASAHNSLKSLFGNSPGLELATRHCFILEDPPNDTKERIELHSTTEVTNGESQKEATQEQTSQKEDSPNENCDQKTQDSTPEAKKPPVAPDDLSIENAQTCEEAQPPNLHMSGTTEIMEDQAPSTAGELNNEKFKAELSPSSVKKTEGKKSGESPELVETMKDVEMSEALPSKTSEHVDDALSNSLPPKEKKHQSGIVNSVEENGFDHETAKDVDMAKQPDKNDLSQPVSGDAAEIQSVEEETKVDDKEKHNSSETKEEDKNDKLKRAAVTTISAAAVKAKLLASQEEDQIRQLSSILIEKQLQKLEYKLAIFSDTENLVMRVREQFERSRQRLYHERAQIIAVRLGMNASSSRMTPSSVPANRISMNFAGQVPRPPLSMTPQRPPMLRPPMGTMALNPAISLSTTTGSSIRPPGQENASSVGKK